MPRGSNACPREQTSLISGLCWALGERKRLYGDASTKGSAMNTKLNAFGLVASCSLLTMFAARATASAQQPDGVDAQVLNKVHIADDMEIAAGRLADKRGSTAEVRAYGATLVHDHKTADKQVRSIAKKLGITLESAKWQSVREGRVRATRSARESRRPGAQYPRATTASRRACVTSQEQWSSGQFSAGSGVNYSFPLGKSNCRWAAG